MIVDLILKSRIAGSIGARLTLQYDRAAVQHDQARPDQQHARMTECDLAIVNADQSCPPAVREGNARSDVEDVFGDLGRDLAGQIRADTRNQGRRNDIARLQYIG